MLHQDNRLRKVRDFNLLMEHGRWLGGKFLVLKLLNLSENKKFFPKKSDPASFAQQLRIAVGTGVKVSKSAVKRNRVRRQVREVLRLLIKDGRIKFGYYLLFSVKPEAVNKDYREIESEVVELLKRSRLLI